MPHDEWENIFKLSVCAAVAACECAGINQWRNSQIKCSMMKLSSFY